MKYVFFGSPEFAAYILDALITAGNPPHSLVANPDRPTGRKQVITPPLTKKVAEKIPDILVLQPEKFDKNFEENLRNINADFFVVAAYAKIIPQSILSISKKGVIGIHPSLLPKYRGASPIQSAILNDEKETGATLYLVDEKMDHGPILAQSKEQIADSDTYETLEKKLADLGSKLLITTLPQYLNNEISPQAQNEKEVTYTKKFNTEDGFIPFETLCLALHGESSPRLIFNQIRALYAEPGVWTLTKETSPRRIKIKSAHIENDRLVLTSIQPEGKTEVRDRNAILRFFPLS